MTLWEIDLHPAPGEPDLIGSAVAVEAADLGLGRMEVHGVRGFLLQGSLDEQQVQMLARELLADLVVERPVVGRVGDERLLYPGSGPVAGTLSAPSAVHGTRSVPTTEKQLIHVLPKPGVTDPVAQQNLPAVLEPIGVEVAAVVLFPVFHSHRRQVLVVGARPVHRITLRPGASRSVLPAGSRRRGPEWKNRMHDCCSPG